MNERIVGELMASGLLIDRDQADHRVTGFDHVCTAAASSMPSIARIFAENHYFLEMLTCVDLRQTDAKLCLIYTFNCFGPHDRHRVAADLAPTTPWSGPPAKKPRRAKGGPETSDAPKETPAPTETAGASIASIFASANWYEREVFDMFGVRFTGHPDLKRLLLPEDADFHPLLRDHGRIEDAS